MIVVTTIDLGSPDSSGKISMSMSMSSMSDNYERDEKVTFSGATPSDDSSKPTVLRDVVRTNRKDKKGFPVYEGYVVSTEDAGKASQAILDDPNTTQTEILLCIHGNLVEPHVIIDAVVDAQVHSEKYLLIPIIWPVASGGLTNFDYGRNRSFARVAGNALREAFEMARNSSISVMAHSLGNRVLLSALEQGCEDGCIKLSNGEDMTFNTVFMVAADVWEETFNERVINGSTRHRDFDNCKVGLYLSQMTKRNIVVVHSTNDLALSVSAHYLNRGFFKSYRRLGFYGSAGQQPPFSKPDRLHELAKTKLVSKDWSKYSRENDCISQHGYQFSSRICRDIYNNY